MTTPTTLHAAAIALGLVACVTDSRARRVPNVLTVTAVVIALLVRGISLGWPGVATGVLGWTLGLLLLLPLFLLRGMGGGDVKLLAAFGAWIGPSLVLWTGLYGAMSGGVLAVVVTLWHGVLRQSLMNIGLLMTHWRVAGMGPVAGFTLETSRSPKLPYAFALTCGLVVALWLKT